MKRIALTVILAGLAACEPAFNDKVDVQTLLWSDTTEGLPSAQLYVHREKNPEAVVLLSCSSAAVQNQWQDTAVRMAVQGYLVVAAVLPSEGGMKERAVSALQQVIIRLRREHPHLKLGVVSDAAGAMTCLQVVVQDSAVSGTALLTPGKEIAGLDSLWLDSWQGRPLLLLSAGEQTPQDSDPLSAWYARLPEPKKTVWLATRQSGADLLYTDREPIIRRTLVLFFDRHLRGKE
ncbi:MAG TPA: hypothetical protein PK843_15655 [bacterium]|nr:hypothetical protein [bacterium]HPN35950.1 hypothetical protein [bacterium]